MLFDFEIMFKWVFVSFFGWIRLETDARDFWAKRWNFSPEIHGEWRNSTIWCGRVGKMGFGLIVIVPVFVEQLLDSSS
jgi:hypothetical protein